MPGAWCLVLGQTLLPAAGESTLGGRSQTFCLRCTLSPSGDIWLPVTLCPGDQRRKRTSPEKAASPGGAAGGCRPDVGWAGPCSSALQVLRLVVRVGDWGALGNTWALSACEECKVSSGERRVGLGGVWGGHGTQVFQHSGHLPPTP